MITLETTKSNYVNPLFKFVTKEAIALLLKIPVEQIRKIRCWPHVILVVSEHLVRFVSYADLPPILEAEPPTDKDILTWRRRWRKLKTYKAPNSWKEFYTLQLRQSTNKGTLQAWWGLVNTIKFALSHNAVQTIKSVFQEIEYLMAVSVSG
ncbi:MAG: hypothetical protein ACKO9I_08595 [Sphaerospermopsis kisseleviana]|jgi:hypothetical protein|uniref:Transposase n=2 Tax=Sphaerospermopsis TaxID=752201 RepID=A0ABR9VHW3_9CYAN|nr:MULTISPECIES: hypothetical protein [Sphaerospermopsis]MBC5797977.1 hypothetical protein [Sphaerospermopsis sp. LEGE 00249]MBE9238079.1 hypothetical protein [Sphaerospermopsis aphanizomenoides LEGE 00250]MDB9440738.1 hypothetical protein [Sphaerospermopsis kisseleviana CS-549]BAZ79394.1 hypothetical protein NIES73_06370 [Sphaerospermopsis kisseleviana NIES-73]